MLKPFEFHYKVRDHFKAQDKTWRWFSEVNVKTEQSEEFRTELLRNTYRLDAASEPLVHKLLEQAREKLGVIVPVTIYQSQYTEAGNAGILFLNNEAHLVLSGPLMKLLNEQELLALIAHELSHILLYTQESGDFEVAGRIIYAIGNDPSSDHAYAETARLFSLYTELYCDTGAYHVCNDASVVISTLIKISTGLDKISAENYLKQADEILGRDDKGSAGESHPESFIRAKAIQLYAENGAGSYPEISNLIAGKPGIFTMDIFTRQEVFDVTRELLGLVLKPAWMQSEMNKAHYQLYFKEFKTSKELLITPAFKEKIVKGNQTLHDYYAAVLLDFALCDTAISEPASALVLDLAEQIGIGGACAKVFKRELKLSDKRFNEYAKNATTALNQVMESEQEKLYE